MKSIFYLITFLLILPVMQSLASGAEYSKTIKKGWLKSGVSTLRISNRFGEVRLNDMGGDSVTIRVKITVDNGSESKARSLMDKIQINFDKTGGTVSAETSIGDDFKNNQSFSIDYLVNVPKDKDLEITNKYGNVVLADLEAKGAFDVAYGSLTGGKLKSPSGSPIRMEISYGKADIETANSMEVGIKYSKLIASEIGQLRLDSKYSTLNVHSINNCIIDSKYDSFNFDEVDRMRATSRYTNYKIGLLSGSFNLDTGYGSVRINRVESRFSEITITNSYGGINIGLNNLNYKLKADCNYCDVAYPEDRFRGNRARESHSITVDGNIGTGGGTVSITSRYGGIKLFD